MKMIAQIVAAGKNSIKMWSLEKIEILAFEKNVSHTCEKEVAVNMAVLSMTLSSEHNSE